MHLKEFSLISPGKRISDVVFKAIETAIPSDVIEQSIGNTGSLEERQRKLPSQLVVCLVIAPEFVVERLNANSPEESRAGFEDEVDEVGTVLASAE